MLPSRSSVDVGDLFGGPKQHFGTAQAVKQATDLISSERDGVIAKDLAFAIIGEVLLDNASTKRKGKLDRL